ncbi:MAG: hypothetical protein RR779_02480 [Comamonas sp.]
MTLPEATYQLDDAVWSRVLKQELASQLQGQSLVFLCGDAAGQTHQISLLVTAFELQSRAVPGMAAFRLNFQGPPAPSLPSQTYRARHADWGDFAIMLSATGADAQGVYYEAQFSHAL